jgi:hypothetical protein
MAYTGWQNPDQGGTLQATSLGPAQPMSQPSYTPNAQGTLTPNVNQSQLASNLGQNPGQYGMSGPGSQSLMDPSFQALLGAYGPQFAQAQAQGQQAIIPLYQQMQLLGPEGALANQQAQQQAGFSEQQIGLNQQQLGIQQGALTREMQLLPQQYGLQQQGFGLSETEAQQGYQQQLRGLNSASTASGSFTSTGANQSRGDLYNNLTNSLQNIGLQRQGAALTFAEQQAQQQDSQKQLGIQAKQLGISEDEVKARLNNALQQTGLSSTLSADQILGQIGQIQQGELSPLSGLLSQIAQLSGITLTGGQ